MVWLTAGVTPPVAYRWVVLPEAQMAQTEGGL